MSLEPTFSIRLSDKQENDFVNSILCVKPENRDSTINEFVSINLKRYEEIEIGDPWGFSQITLIETGQVVLNYKTTITEKFEIDGDLYVRTTGGEVANITSDLTEMFAIIQRRVREDEIATSPPSARR